MAIKYLYIDDEANTKPTIPEGIIRILSPIGSETLQIDLEPALSWNKQLQYIKNNISNYDGILLDLKLEFSIEGDDQILHYAPSLAQEFRSLVKRNEIKDFPIFLCSTDDILRSSYDTTSEDLFDECFDKIKLKEEDQVYFLDHAKAYQEISKDQITLESLLKVNEDNKGILEDFMQYYSQLKTTHTKAKFLLRQIIEPVGIFVDEDTLAIRLGIDRFSSKEEWAKLRDEELVRFKYKGIYNEAYPRWWMRGIFSWWNEKAPHASNLVSLSSEERVTILDEIGHKGLAPLGLKEHQKSTKYWYKCANYLLDESFDKILIPVADGDGFELLAPKYPWQDISIISKNYAWVEGSKEVIESIEKLLSPYFIDDLSEMLEKRN